MTWPDCSPPSDSACGEHLAPCTYLSPTGRADESDALVAKRHLEPDVAHHRRDDRVAARRPRRFMRCAHSQQDGVAVDDASALVDEDRAIAVAVERDAESDPPLDDARAQSRRDAVDPQPRLMLRPSGSRRSRPALEPSSRNRRRRDRGRRAVGAVDREAHAGEPRSAQDAAARCATYASDSRSRRPDRASPRAVPATTSAMIASTCASSVSVNFSPSPENTLMPLSSNGLWDAEITTPASNPSRGVRYAIAGRRDHARARSALAPSEPRTPRQLLFDPGPDSRVSRPTTNRRGARRLLNDRAAQGVDDCERRAALRWGDRGELPAFPRTPSVPNSSLHRMLTADVRRWESRTADAKLLATRFRDLRPGGSYVAGTLTPGHVANARRHPRWPRSPLRDCQRGRRRHGDRDDRRHELGTRPLAARLRQRRRERRNDRARTGAPVRCR